MNTESIGHNKLKLQSHFIPRSSFAFTQISPVIRQSIISIDEGGDIGEQVEKETLLQKSLKLKQNMQKAISNTARDHIDTRTTKDKFPPATQQAKQLPTSKINSSKKILDKIFNDFENKTTLNQEGNDLNRSFVAFEKAKYQDKNASFIKISNDSIDTSTDLIHDTSQLEIIVKPEEIISKEEMESRINVFEKGTRKKGRSIKKKRNSFSKLTRKSKQINIEEEEIKSKKLSEDTSLKKKSPPKTIAKINLEMIKENAISLEGEEKSNNKFWKMVDAVLDSPKYGQTQENQFQLQNDIINLNLDSNRNQLPNKVNNLQMVSNNMNFHQMNSLPENKNILIDNEVHEDNDYNGRDRKLFSFYSKDQHQGEKRISQRASDQGVYLQTGQFNEIDPIAERTQEMMDDSNDNNSFDVSLEKHRKKSANKNESKYQMENFSGYIIDRYINNPSITVDNVNNFVLEKTNKKNKNEQITPKSPFKMSSLSPNPLKSSLTSKTKEPQTQENENTKNELNTKTNSKKNINALNLNSYLKMEIPKTNSGEKKANFSEQKTVSYRQSNQVDQLAIEKNEKQMRVSMLHPNNINNSSIANADSSHNNFFSNVSTSIGPAQVFHIENNQQVSTFPQENFNFNQEGHRKKEKCLPNSNYQIDLKNSQTKREKNSSIESISHQMNRLSKDKTNNNYSKSNKIGKQEDDIDSYYIRYKLSKVQKNNQNGYSNTTTNNEYGSNSHSPINPQIVSHKVTSRTLDNNIPSLHNHKHNNYKYISTEDGKIEAMQKYSAFKNHKNMSHKSANSQSITYNEHDINHKLMVKNDNSYSSNNSLDSEDINIKNKITADHSHQYVVLQKNLPYSNYKLDLQRKSKISNRNEILYNNIADYPTINQLISSVKKAYVNSHKNLKKVASTSRSKSPNVNTPQTQSLIPKDKSLSKSKEKNEGNRSTNSKPTKHPKNQIPSNKTNSNNESKNSPDNNDILIQMLEEIKRRTSNLENAYRLKEESFTNKIEELNQQINKLQENEKNNLEEISSLKFKVELFAHDYKKKSQKDFNNFGSEIKREEIDDINNFNNYVEVKENETGKIQLMNTTMKSNEIINDNNEGRILTSPNVGIKGRSRTMINLSSVHDYNYDLEEKFSKLNIVPKFKSFVQMLKDFGLKTVLFYEEETIKQNLFKNDICEDIQCNENEQNFRNFFIFILDECGQDTWNYKKAFKLYPKLKTFIEFLAKKIIFDGKSRLKLEEKTLKIFSNDMIAIDNLVYLYYNILGSKSKEIRNEKCKI